MLYRKFKIHKLFCLLLALFLLVACNSGTWQGIDVKNVEGGAMLIDFENIKNPVVDIDGWAVKDACMIWREGYFYIFASAFFYEDDKERSHLLAMRTAALGEECEILFCTYGKELGFYGFASPDISVHEGKYYLTYNSWGDKPGEANRLFYAVSDDLQNWELHKPLAPKTTEGVRAIDAAIAFANDKVYLCWKEKQSLKFAVASDISDENWTRIPEKIKGWYENVQFIFIDDTWYMLATGYDILFRHRPHILKMEGDPQLDENWGKWENIQKFNIPEEEFNTAELANAAYLYDARDSDGVFYLLYAGTIDQSLHAKRGDCRLGIARSVDLINWETP